MTVQDATRMWSRNGATISTEDGNKNKAVIREGYQIITDPTDTLIEVTAAGALPRRGDPYPGTFQIRVKDRNFKQASPVLWHCDITYEGEFGAGGAADNPLNQRPTIKWGKVDAEEPIDEDVNGKPIATVLGEPIQGVTKQISDLTVTITRNYAAIDFPTTYAYLHSVSSDNFAGFPAGTARMIQFDADEQWSRDIGGYYTVTAGIQFRFPYRTTPNKSWWARVRHEGFRYKTSTDEIRQATIDGEPVSEPVLLAADGTKLPDNAENAHWLEFEIYEKRPFNALGLI